MDLIFIDTETTGFGDCRLVELAWARAEGAISSLRVKPPIPMTEDAIATHGITEEAIKDLPAFGVHPEYHTLKDLFESNICVMHNADFDISVLAREGIRISNYLCTKRVSRRLYPSLKSHRLQELRDYFYMEVEGEAHSAGGDVAVLIALYKQMRTDMEIDGTAPEDVVTQMARISIH